MIALTEEQLLDFDPHHGCYGETKLPQYLWGR
jgi:hypothetical protein